MSDYPPIQGYYPLDKWVAEILTRFPDPASVGADPHLTTFWPQVLRYVAIYEQMARGMWPKLPEGLTHTSPELVERAGGAFYFDGDGERLLASLEDERRPVSVPKNWHAVSYTTKHTMPSFDRGYWLSDRVRDTYYVHRSSTDVVVSPTLPEDVRTSAYLWGLDTNAWGMAWGFFPVQSTSEGVGYYWPDIRVHLKKVEIHERLRGDVARFRPKSYDGRVEIPEFDLLPVGPKPEVPEKFDKLVLEFMKNGGVDYPPDDLGELFCSLVGAVVELDPDAPQIMWLTVPGLEEMPEPLWVGPANRVPLRAHRSKVSWSAVINLALAAPYDVMRAYEKVPWATPQKNPKVYTLEKPYPDEDKIQNRQKKLIRQHWQNRLRDLAQQLSQSAVPIEYLFDLDRYRRGVGQTSQETHLLAWKLLGAEIIQHPFFPAVIRYDGKEVWDLTDETRAALHAILYPLADIEQSYPRPANRDYMRDFTIRTCPVCFRDIKVDEHYRMVDHGYHLRGTKYDAYRGRAGSCSGYLHRSLCWERSSEATRTILLEPLEEKLAQWRSYYTRLSTCPVSTWREYRQKVKDREDIVTKPGDPGYLEMVLSNFAGSYYENLRTHWDTSGIFSTERLSWLRAALRTWKPRPDNKPAILAPRVKILPEDVHDAPTYEWYQTCRREIIRAYEAATGEKYVEQARSMGDLLGGALSRMMDEEDE